MSEKISAYEQVTGNEIEINASALDYYRNGTYLHVKRRVERCSQLDLLPIYAQFKRSRRFSANARAVGKHNLTRVSLAEFFLEDSVCSLDTLTFDCAKLDNQAAVEPTTYTVEKVGGRIKAGRAGGAVLDVFLALDSPDQQLALEVEAVERAFRASDIAYQRKKDTRSELYLGALHTPDGFHDDDVDEFLDTLIDEAPLEVQTEPFAVPTVDLAA